MSDSGTLQHQVDSDNSDDYSSDEDYYMDDMSEEEILKILQEGLQTKQRRFDPDRCLKILSKIRVENNVLEIFKKRDKCLDTYINYVQG